MTHPKQFIYRCDKELEDSMANILIKIKEFTIPLDSLSRKLEKRIREIKKRND